MNTLVPMAVALSVLGAPPLAPQAPVDAPAAALVAKAAGTLDKALADKAPKAHEEALEALGASHRADAKEKLLAALMEDDGHSRFGAAQGLRLLADPSTQSAIATAWRKEKGWAVKKELSLAAGAAGAQELIGDLKAALLYETQQDVRESVAWALEDLGDSSAKPALAQMGNPQRKSIIKDGADSWSRHVLTGKKPGDRRLAVHTLAMMGSRADVPLLEKALDSADAQERLWAAAGIVRLSRLRKGEEVMAAIRRANVKWEGDLASGVGKVTAATSGAFKDQPVSWPARTEEANGKTSPEELLAAAHASCFAMALSGRLARAGTPGQKLEVSATVTFDKADAGWKLKSSALEVKGWVKGATEASFQEAAQGAKDGCPISSALKGNVELSVQATLAT